MKLNTLKIGWKASVEIREGGAVRKATFTEVAKLALEAHDLQATTRLLTYGMVQIGNAAIFLLPN